MICMAGKNRSMTPHVAKKVRKKKPARGRAALRKAYNKQFLATDSAESDAVGPNSRATPIVTKLFLLDPMALGDLQTGNSADSAAVQDQLHLSVHWDWKHVEWHSGTGGWSSLSPHAVRSRRRATKKTLTDDMI
jgi:ribosomal protein S30